MSHLSKLLLLGLVLSFANAEAAEGMKGITFSGSVEGGYAATWLSTPAVNDSQFMIDHATLRMDAGVSDKTKIVIENTMSVMPVPGSNIAPNQPPMFSSSSYFSGATLRTATGDLAFSNSAAYIDHKWAEGIHTWIGNFMTPFGMESMGGRWDMNTFYYSAAYAHTNDVNGLGWMYDVGIKASFQNIIPGNLEIAVLDGRQSATGRTPAGSLRYNYEFKKGDLSFTPVVSGYFGASNNIGFTGGGMFKTGAIFANAEFVYTSTNIFGVKQILWSAYAEPGIDFGMFTLSAKGDFVNDSVNSDFNIGAAISHEYAGAFRVKLAYERTGLGGRVIAGNLPNINDLRVLFGVKF